MARFRTKFGCEQFLKEINETSNLYRDALIYTTDEYDELQKAFEKIRKETKKATNNDRIPKDLLDKRNTSREMIRNSFKTRKAPVDKTSDELSHPTQIVPPVSIPAPCVIRAFQKEKYNTYTSCTARISRTKFVIPNPYGKPTPPVLESYTSLQNRVNQQLEVIHKKNYQERLLASFSQSTPTSAKGKKPKSVLENRKK